jgi:hypothetical protein
MGSAKKQVKLLVSTTILTISHICHLVYGAFLNGNMKAMPKYHEN